MKILIIGSGGRESAIAWKLKEDARVSKLYFAPGNATTDALGQNILETGVAELRSFALRENIDLTIVGPEAPLVSGIVDEFNQHGLKVFGPQKRVAQLEGSKAFSKKFMQTNGIKTANAIVFEAYDDAIDYVENHKKFPIVIKASGLAAGKGVVICEDLEEAKSIIHSFMIEKIHGDAGIQIVIEDFLTGFETSIIAFSNGEKLFPCIPVKDYKRARNGDLGPNTGGMGAVAPCPNFTADHFADFTQNILEPTLKGLKDNGLSFKGFIFFGLMVTPDQGVYLLEYNMRLGDPETQVIMALMESSLLDAINSCIEGKDVNLKFSDEKKAVCLVMCSGGYPGNIQTGFEVRGINKAVNSQLLFAGAERREDQIITTGGRVLNLVATGNSYEEARRKVYKDAVPVSFDYEYYREDIGKF